MRSPLQSTKRIPLERLSEEKYGNVLCYPKYDPKELRRRLNELEELKIEAIEFTGDKRVAKTPVLGKGYVGIVVAAHTHTGKVALKIRRVDADRVSMQHEGRMLKRANAVDVGPKLLDVTKNFLVMEFVEGRLLPGWIRELEGNEMNAKICGVLQAILEQCWTLDAAGLDHGQLSRAPKHIMVDKKDKPRIVDFETASINRKASNVTAVCQYLFIGSQLAREITRKHDKINKSQLIDALKRYKRRRTRRNFERILDGSGLCETISQSSCDKT